VSTITGERDDSNRTIRTVVDVYPVNRTTTCGRSGTDLQRFVWGTVRQRGGDRPHRVV